MADAVAVAPAASAASLRPSGSASGGGGKGEGAAASAMLPPGEPPNGSGQEDAADATDVPGIHLHCSDALTRTFSMEEQGERARAVMQSSPRMPAVGFFGGRYGDRWYVDIISLMHNAVRRQLFDAFTVANALGKLVLDVSDVDLARVYAWLGTLDAFVRACFAAEDAFIYPLIDTHVRNARTADGADVYLPELLSARGRREAKSHVLDLLAAARKTRDVATGETKAKVNALRYALDQFGGNILDYFAAMERFAPKLLKKSIKHGTKEKSKVERKVFEYILTQSQGAMLAALLMQCIESRSRRKDFLERNLRKEKMRTQFKAHVKSVEATHMQLSRTFDRVARQYAKRFNVQAFVEHYDAANDGKQTLEMFGGMDINYEPGKAGEALRMDSVEVDADALLDDDVVEVSGEHEGLVLSDQFGQDSDDDAHADRAYQGGEDDAGDALDDDVIEVRANVEDAMAMEARQA